MNRLRWSKVQGFWSQDFFLARTWFYKTRSVTFAAAKKAREFSSAGSEHPDLHREGRLGKKI
jgi:hypothetical protein